jgi:hypothetical protein
MSSLISKLLKFFSTNHTSNLDLYLKSKNVQNTADVEYWIRQWDKHQRTHF